MSYLCNLFLIFSLIFIVINHMISLKQTHLFFVCFLEYLQLLLDDNVDEKSNFCQSKPDVAYKSVLYKKSKYLFKKLPGKNNLMEIMFSNTAGFNSTDFFFWEIFGIYRTANQYITYERLLLSFLIFFFSKLFNKVIFLLKYICRSLVICKKLLFEISYWKTIIFIILWILIDFAKGSFWETLKRSFAKVDYREESFGAHLRI